MPRHQKELKDLLAEKEKAISAGKLDDASDKCHLLALYYRKNGDLESCSAEHEEEALYAVESSKWFEGAIAMRLAIDAHLELRHFTVAMKACKRYQEYAEKSRDPNEIQAMHHTIGRFYLDYAVDADTCEADRTLHLNKAESALQSASQLIDGLEDKIDANTLYSKRARVLHNLADVAWQRGQKVTAFERLKQSINLACLVRKEPDVMQQLHRSYYDMASWRKDSYDWEQALRNAKLALQHAKDWKPAQMDTYLLISSIHLEARDFRRSRLALQKAYLLRKEASWPVAKQKLKAVAKLCELDALSGGLRGHELLKTYERMGDLLSGPVLQSPKSAVDFYEKMLSVAQELGANPVPAYVSLAETYRDIKDFEKAYHYYELERESQATENSPDAVTSLINLAVNALDAGRPADAVDDLFAEASRIATMLKSQKLQLKVALRWQECLTCSGRSRTDVSCILAQFKADGLSLSDSEEEAENTPSANISFHSDGIAELSDANSDSDDERCVIRRRNDVIVGGYRVRCNEKGESELHRAIIDEKPQLFYQLLQKGHPVNLADNSGYTPLHEAVNIGAEAMTEELLRRGADVNAKTGQPGGYLTPLLDAACNGHLNIIKLLRDHGANVLVTDKKGRDVIHFLESVMPKLSDCPEWMAIYHRVRSSILREMDKARFRRQTRAEFSDESETSENESVINANDMDEDIPLSTLAGRPPPSLRRRRQRQRNALRGETAQHTNTIVDLTKPGSGPKSYREAIRALGSRANKSGPTTSRVRNSSDSENSAPMFVRSDRMVDDDWLIDDLGGRSGSAEPPPARRQRNASGGSSNISLTSHKRPLRTPAVDIRERSTRPAPRKRSADEYPASKSRRTTAPAPVPVRINDDDSDDDLLAAMDFQDLTDSPGVGFATQSTPVARPPPEPLVITQPSTSQQVLPVSAPVNSATAARAPRRVRVKVDEVSFLIPVTGCPTVQWLASEASDRYYHQFGKRPILGLQTSDGAQLSLADPLLDVIGLEEQVWAVVQSWQLIALGDRYVEKCTQGGTQLYENIRVMLDYAATSQQLRLENMGLRECHLTPVFKALQSDYQIVSLVLSGCALGDTSSRELGKALPMLLHLDTLHLNSCDITHLSFTSLVSALNAKPLLHLCSLDLSHNWLQNASYSTLCSLIRLCPTLRRLTLNSICITANFFASGIHPLQSAMASLSDQLRLSLCGNDLTSNGAQKLLHCLAPEKIQSLYLSDSFSEADSQTNLLFGQFLLEFSVGESSCLQTLDLSHTDLSFPSFDLLCQSLTKLQYLKRLELRAQRVLNNDSFGTLLEASQNHPALSQLDVLDCSLELPFDPILCNTLERKCSSVASAKLEWWRVTFSNANDTTFAIVEEIWRKTWAPPAGRIQKLGTNAYLLTK